MTHGIRLSLVIIIILSISDLPFQVGKASVSMYADDHQVYVAGHACEGKEPCKRWKKVDTMVQG